MLGALKPEVNQGVIHHTLIPSYNNKTTRVWFLRKQKHTSDGLWPGFPGQRPSRVCFCSLRKHTSVVLYLSYATKTTFNSRVPRAKFAMTLRRRSHDITSTCPTIRMTSLRIPDDTDATEEICITHMLYLIILYHPGYHGSIAGLYRSNFVMFFTKYIALVIASARSRINFAPKGILVCIC
jgi:hypothetical protein